jgi:anaerobic nitric oxide reductase transcription regulator
VEQEVETGRYRTDLFLRLNVYPPRVPPLRERVGDIPLLAGYFCDVLRRHLGLGPIRIAPDAMAALQQYPGPGNVRELQNPLSRVTLKAAARIARGKPVLIRLSHLASDFAGTEPSTREFQRSMIERALAAHGNNWSAAARSLGMHRTNLHHLAVRLGLK